MTTDDFHFRRVRWTMQHLVELLDEAIDTAGKQLARSEGLLWKGERPARVRRAPVSADVGDELDAGPELV